MILNAGVIHRVGPNRLHVRIARQLAEAGFPSFRFDLPGVGDSDSLGGSGSLMEDAVTGVGEAFALLTRQEVADRFVLFGLCSGADLSFIVACHDPRVIGMAIVDPTEVFPTARATALRAIAWLLRPVSWVRLVTGQYRLSERLRGPVAMDGADDPVESASKEQVADGLKTLVSRGAQICYIMTRDRREYRYRDQLFDAFPGIGLEHFTDIVMFPDSDHTFPSEDHRTELTDVSVEWVRQWWSPASEETTTEMPGVLPTLRRETN